MKMLNKFLFVASALALSPVAPAAAQSVAFSDIDRAIATSQAYISASQQIGVTFKNVLEQLETRQRVVNAELNAMAVKLDADQKANPNAPTLQAQYNAIQEKRRAAQEELSKLGEPVARANAYVQEQIDAKLEAAVSAAMAKKKIALLLQRNAILQSTPGTDLTPDIVKELNTLVPNVSITPPAGWQPGQQQRAPTAQPAQGR